MTTTSEGAESADEMTTAPTASPRPGEGDGTTDDVQRALLAAMRRWPVECRGDCDGASGANGCVACLLGGLATGTHPTHVLVPRASHSALPRATEEGEVQAMRAALYELAPTQSIRFAIEDSESVVLDAWLAAIDSSMTHVAAARLASRAPAPAASEDAQESAAAHSAPSPGRDRCECGNLAEILVPACALCAERRLVSPGREEGARAVRDVEAERERQKAGEGWNAAHDDRHDDGSLAMAAACYAAPHEIARKVFVQRRCNCRGVADCWHSDEYRYEEPWPWHWTWDKRGRHPRRRQLVIAAALLLAEIERLDRSAAKEG